MGMRLWWLAASGYTHVRECIVECALAAVLCRTEHMITPYEAIIIVYLTSKPSRS